MNKRLLRISLAMVCMFGLAPLAFSQTQIPKNGIPQEIVIGGQQANGAYVTAPTGRMQSFTCPSPQQYVTPDGGSNGWACYDQATGVWLLNAVPPAAAQAPAPVQVAPQQPDVIYQQPPSVIYQQPAPVVVYAAPGYGYGYPYGYGYYGYGYGYGYPVYSRGFSVGIGFGGFRGGFRGGRSGRR